MSARVDALVIGAALLRRVRSTFEQATAALARACARNGQLDAARLDQHQVASYELAWVSADLLAADTQLATLGGAGTEVDRRLALVFAVDAITARRWRHRPTGRRCALPAAAHWRWPMPARR